MKAGKILLKTAVAILIPVVMAIGCALCWIYSWTWRGELREFHASWSPEERAALAELDSYLRQQWVKDTYLLQLPFFHPDKEYTPEEQAYINLFYHTPEHKLPALNEQKQIISAWRAQCPPAGLWKQFKADCIARCLIAPVAEQLIRIAAEGKAGYPSPVTDTDSFILRQLDVDNQVDTTPAIEASLSGRFEALRALIRHGAAPNAQRRTLYSSVPGDEYEEDLPITPLLAGISYSGIRYPWRERKHHAEFLLEQGADLNRSPFIASCCLVDLAIHHHAETFLWALEHGLKPNICHFCSIIMYPGTLPLVRYILEQKLVDANNLSGNATAAQSIVWAACEAESVDELIALEAEEKLRLLLQAGANPHLICRNAEPQHPGESDDDYEKRHVNAAFWAETTAPALLKQRIEELKASPDADNSARLQVLERLLGLISDHS